MSALVVRQEPYRALQVFDSVPAGHTVILIAHDRWAPHLNAGEFAIVGVEDKSRECGELYDLSPTMLRLKVDGLSSFRSAAVAAGAITSGSGCDTNRRSPAA